MMTMMMMTLTMTTMAMMFDGCQGRKPARKGEVALAHGSSHSNQQYDDDDEYDDNDRL